MLSFACVRDRKRNPPPWPHTISIVPRHYVHAALFSAITGQYLYSGDYKNMARSAEVHAYNVYVRKYGERAVISEYDETRGGDRERALLQS